MALHYETRYILLPGLVKITTLLTFLAASRVLVNLCLLFHCRIRKYTRAYVVKQRGRAKAERKEGIADIVM